MKKGYPILLLLPITRQKLEKTNEKHKEKRQFLFECLDLDTEYKRLLYAQSFYYVTIGSMHTAQFKCTSFERMVNYFPEFLYTKSMAKPERLIGL